MGQLVAVTEKPSATPGVVRFELNRTLSGQGHQHFAVGVEPHGQTPSDELARRMFATGQVAGVHVYANIVTVDLAKGFGSDGLSEIVRDLYQYWTPGMEPPVFADDEAGDAGGDAGSGGEGSGGEGGGDGDAALTEAAKRVPMHLLERSRAARARWAAKAG
jgi:hypothetical protein